MYLTHAQIYSREGESSGLSDYFTVRITSTLNIGAYTVEPLQCGHSSQREESADFGGSNAHKLGVGTVKSVLFIEVSSFQGFITGSIIQTGETANTQGIPHILS